MLVRLGALGAGVLTSAAMVVVAPVAASADSPHHHQPGITQHNLISDQPGQAALTDPTLVNAWGIARGPNTTIWVSNQGASTSTLYTGAVNGAPPEINPLVVKIPGGPPSGQAFNDTSAFDLPGTNTPSRFLFAGLAGDVTAWSSGTSAVVAAQQTGAIYTGVAVDDRQSDPLLLAADFHDNRIDVYNGKFDLQPAGSMFQDRTVPRNYAPFNVAEIGHQIIVTYAQQDAQRQVDVAGQGHGIVDVYSQDGRLLHRLATHGVLNSPWGVSDAPAHFGAYSGDLLIGNFGDGRIHAYDPRTGHYRGTVRDAHHKPIVIDGLWGLITGNAQAGGPDSLWFSSGPGAMHEHGLVGTLTAG